ncbi:MAG: MucB/RseB C-terminal domain-containing protein [Pseudomonadota bacterium]
MRAAWLLCLVALGARAGDPLPPAEAAVWLQRMADAARHVGYEGVFAFQHGDAPLQSLMVSNRPAPAGKDSRLLAMDGEQREVRCSQGISLSMQTAGGQVKVERRLNSRHFPDLLPANATPLANWYNVRLGEVGRVAGLDCRQVELTPRDAFRWGYVLCAEKETGLPLKAMMINDAGKPLMQYAFAEVKLGALPRNAPPPAQTASEAARPVAAGRVGVKSLPPGFTRITAVKRQLPNKPGEVEHWVFSDGLTHISLFLENAAQPVETLRGQSKLGMINMLTRQVGAMQATILGDAPWPAVEAIAMNLEARPGTVASGK